MGGSASEIRKIAFLGDYVLRKCGIATFTAHLLEAVAAACPECECFAVMLRRQDYENIYLMFSDHLHFWTDTQTLLKPAFPWEFIQMGNCGSPLETEAGWLVLSHGVGPMRQYCIGAFLLDLNNPARVLGRLPEPLLKPSAAEREG